MVIPKINSAHGSDTRNIINRAIDSINVQGKSIQDLVAKGQLTPAQYATLIESVNGLISKGNVSLNDLSPEVLKVFKDIAPEFNLLSIPRNNSVNGIKTTFLKRSDNLFNGEYLDGIIVGSSSAGYRVQKEFDGNIGTVIIAPIKPNKEYTIKIHEPTLSNRFLLGASINKPDFESGPFDLDTHHVNNNNLKEYTFTNNSTARWLCLYVSSTGNKPKIHINEGRLAQEYDEPYVVGENLLDKNIRDKVLRNTFTIIEDPNTGYPPRPNSISVIWIGPNMPEEVEPYDEWRETEGFIYYSDFKSGTGSLDDWEKVWGGAGLSEIDDDGILNFRPDLADFYSMAWRAVEDKKNGDAEVFIKSKLSRIPSGGGSNFGVIIRGSGNAGYESGYTITFRVVDGNLTLSVGRLENGSSTIIDSSRFNVDITKEFYMSSRIVGDNIKAKIWQVGIKEPYEWLIDTIDNNPLTQSGYTGLYTYNAGITNYVFEVGVGTGGMRAPRRAVLE